MAKKSKSLKPVFISYSQKDTNFVNTFSALLQNYGLNVWKDSKDIQIGENIPKRIYEGIKNSSHFCTIISKHSIGSKWVEEELAFAKIRQLSDQSLKIIPILIDKVNIPDYVLAYLCAHLENRDLSPNNLEYIKILNALGIKLKQENVYIVKGKSRKDLIKICSDLRFILTELREHLEIFHQMRNQEEFAYSNELLKREIKRQEQINLEPPIWSSMGSDADELEYQIELKWKNLQSIVNKNDISGLIEDIKNRGMKSRLKGFDIWDSLVGNLSDVNYITNTIISSNPKKIEMGWGSNPLIDYISSLNRFITTLESWEVFETK